MGDAGTPRGRSRTEDGGPSTQRGEPFGEDGDSLLAGGFGHAWPQAPDVVILIGSEAGSAAALTATAALTLSRGHYRISLRPLPRASEASPPAKLAPCGAGFLGTRACCNRDKFKLLVLECT